MATLRRRRRMSGAVEGELKRLLEEGWAPTQVHTALTMLFKGKGDPIPTLRTVQRIARELRPEDRSGPWTVATAEPGTVRVILDVLRALQDATEGRISHVTEREADWLLRISEAAPTLAPLLAWRLAREVMLREDANEDAGDLDSFLAFAPNSEAGPDERLRLAVAHAETHARLWPNRSWVPWSTDQEVVDAFAKARGLPSGKEDTK